MLNKNVNILSTKKLSLQQVQFAKGLNVHIVDIDFIDINIHLTHDTKTILNKIENDTVIFFTSQHAVKATTALLQDKTIEIYCINGTTLTTINRQLPKAIILASATNAADLMQLVTINPKKKYYFFCGNKSLTTIPELFRKKNIPLIKKEVYTNTYTPQKITTHFDAVMFYSPSGVESFLTENEIPETSICIGKTTANTVKINNGKNLLIAQKPTIDSMLQLIKNKIL